MDEGDKGKTSWWQTVPGILTATAAIITAVAGLIVTLHQAGMLGGKNDPPARIVEPTSQTESPRDLKSTGSPFRAN